MQISNLFEFDVSQRNCQRANRALDVQVPLIKADLEESKDFLTELGETLPQTQAQLADIRYAYDSGRDKVCCIRVIVEFR